MKKTLTEEMNDIKNLTSKAAQKRALVKLGLSKDDIDVTLWQWGKETTTSTFTFGVEIECYNVNKDRLIATAGDNGCRVQYEGYNHRDHRDKVFKLVTDSSLRGEMPIECVSPVLSGKADKSDLKKVCQSLNAIGAKVNQSTGLHVHIGLDNTTDKQYINIFMNYYYLEDVIDSFMAASRRNNGYAQSLRDKWVSIHNSHTKADLDRNMGSRYYKVNPRSYYVHNTIEFRQHQGTTNYTKIAHWIDFCAKLVEYSKKHVLTAHVNSIDEIPFLTAAEKRYFSARKAEIAQ